LVPGKPAINPIFFEVGGLDVAAEVSAINFGLSAYGCVLSAVVARASEPRSRGKKSLDCFVAEPVIERAFATWGTIRRGEGRSMGIWKKATITRRGCIFIINCS
jgi:hypothetical protein